MKIKDKKTSLLYYYPSARGHDFRLITGTQGRNRIKYLGFRYDGQKVYIRDSTLSNLRRRVVLAARRDAIKLVKRYSDKDISSLRALFNYERLIKRFGKVEDFFEKESDCRSWTFWSYSVRAANCFGRRGRSILRQLRTLRALIIRRADDELDKAVRKFGVTSP